MTCRAFDAQQRSMARWMGYPDAAAMNAQHDDLHAALCRWLGIESQALRQASGQALDRWEAHLASIEEDAVLAVQGLVAHAGAEVPP